MAVAVLRPEEAAWNDRFDSLQKRFPAVSAERVATTLRSHHGHAGFAARDLRELDRVIPKEADPDDSEWVSTLLSNPTMFRQTCRERFLKFDANRNGYLELSEICGLINDLSEFLGLDTQSENCIRAFFESNDDNNDGRLSDNEFARFFETFLRYAFFMEHRKLVGTWSFQPDVSRPVSMQYRIVQTKDWRLQIRCALGACPGAPGDLETVCEGHEIKGVLELQGGWLSAELKQGTRGSDRRQYGTLRVRLDDNGNGDTLTSNFRGAISADWGRSVVASRASEFPTSPSRPNSLKAGSPIIDRRKSAVVRGSDSGKLSERRPNSCSSVRGVDSWRLTKDSCGQVLGDRPREAVVHAWD